MNKHTPGPWTVDPLQYREDGSVQYFAPDMLEALKDVTEIASLFAGHVRDGIADVAIAAARAAIAKVDGKP